jgi:tetratricopeptide (TPR) repeat protein
MKNIGYTIFAATLLRLCAPVHAQSSADDTNCGNPFDNGVGPWDYNNAANYTFDRIPIVERYHFNADVEHLVRGQSTVNIVEDLDYVLRAVPNHPRALNAIATWQLRTGRVDPKFRSAECYFDRAMRFAPDDPVVRLVLGIYRVKKGDREGALTAYNEALKLAPGSAEAHYNIGLLYFELKKYSEAREHAKTAYQLGYPLPGLRQMLQRAGAWSDSDSKPTPAAADK